ncbi:hypothetical protein A1Q1_02749 [Trichosporon asahii var. asahii CBS 2479]|uniref:Uncharacterized protein n=1 Tax=Trichosporon asahii var. asahii (strain ATCC 90039 / CBS 2479 / JCM 2466 / KCTC 7840 / NBRC 103889/ NCYC 2677 / UAMH 7654) TaxID=1186058 RepID=J6F6L0_TRIAS|nr:hypothetical protein A1Q1_02749 [Trichosporon asahii var. asahii CBS 2479]EJT52699.1 hypothetical protein A1Q1_02749 [Trichosporon asahii var. asahii CBS 2479]
MAVMVEEAVKTGAKEEGFWCQLGAQAQLRCGTDSAVNKLGDDYRQAHRGYSGEVIA